MLKNLGKSVAYSSVDVLTKLAPNTTDMLRGARNGVDYTRDVIRTQASKLKVQQTQFDRSTINRQARMFLQDAWNDIKQGNLALGDLSDQSMDDWDKFMDDFNSPGSSSITSYSDSQFNDGEPNNDQSGRMSAGTSATLISSDRRTLQGLQQLAKVTSNTTLKATQFQTEQITNALFVQMTAQNEHFIQIEKKLDSINANLVQLVKFQSESQGVTNQAMMNFMDQMTRWMKNQDKIQANRSRRSPKSFKSAAERFLSSNRFDMSEYGKVIKDNIDASPLGIALSMGSMLSPDMLMMAMGGGFGGKIQPQKFLLNALLTALIPKSARRSIGRGDSQIGTMAKTMLTRLGARKYSMDSGGLGSTILGLLGSVFGIDTNLRRTINLGHYKKDDMNWNGEAQKALVQVIPKELAEIKAALTGKDARYFDAGTGTYMDRKQIKRNTKVRFQNAIENPFANIFNNEFSSNPDERRNKMLWASMSDEFQKQVETIINEAIMNNEGMSTELNKALDKAIGKGIRDAGGTKFDTQRMVMKLADAVNESRSNLANVIEELQAQNSAFTQIAADMADDYGRIKFKDLQNFIGGSAVDLVEATGGRYAANGRRFDQMTAEERRAYEASFNTARRFRDKVRGMKNSRNRFVRGAGRVIETVDDYRTGARQNRYSRAVTGAVDNASYAAYRAAMLGENPLQRTRRQRQGVDWDQFDQENGINPEPDSQRVRRASTSMSDDTSTTRRRTSDARNGQPESEQDQDRSNVLRRAGGIVNQAVARINAKAQGSPEETATIENAENTDEMRQTLDAAFGLKGYMRKIFDSPVMKTLAEKFKNSAIGKAIGAKLEGAKKFTGGVLKEGFKDLSNRYINLMKTAFGFTVDDDGEIDQNAAPTPGSAAEAIQESAQEITDATEAITGSDGTKDAKKQAQDQVGKILKSFSAFMKKNAPRGIMGAAIGGAIPVLAGGKMGLIGGLFMPGGAIGGAILGASLGLLSKTSAFQNFLFGPEDENGERSGGLIKKDMVDKFKKALPTLGVGATAGVILKLLSGATGIGGGLAGGVAGFIPNMLLPGGVIGAAIMGSAAAFALKNEKVQDIIFGAKDEDGKRKGALLSGVYNKFTSLLKGEAFKQKAGDKGSGQSLLKRVMKGMGAAGAGALGATALSQMGILGSTLTFGGPIGTAIAGAAIGILGTSEKFQQYVYGTKDEDGKRKKDGLLSRFTTMLQLNLVEPVSQYFKTTTEQFAWWAKEKIEVPFRLALGPVIDSFKDLRDSMKDAATGAIKKGGEFIGKKIENILSPIGSFFMKYILKPLGSAAGGLLKTGLFAGASIAGAPFQILSTLLSPVRRKQQKKFGNFLKENKEQNLQQYWESTGRTGRTQQFFDRLQYNAATLPLVGNLFRGSDVIGDVAEDIYGDPTGQNRNSLNWLNAKRDRKTYRQERKNLRKEDKEWRKLSRVRQQISKSVGNNADAEFSPIEFDNWQKKLKKMGVDIKDADELRKFTFDYNGWKNPKPDKAAEQQSQMAKDTGAIKGLMEKAVNYLASIADTNRANIDIQTGTVTDTEDIDTGEVSEEIDSDKVEQIQNQRNASTVNAFSGLINKIFKRKKKEANDEAVKGNTSGNATDEETAEQMVEDAGVGEAENDQSGGDKSEAKTGILSTVFGGIGRVLTSKAGLAALASAAVLAVIGNDEMRKMIGDGIGKALGGAKDWIMTKLGFQKDPNGQDTSREADIDGDGETESIANQDVIRDTASILVKGKKGITTAINTLSHVPVVGSVVKAGKAAVKGTQKVGQTAATVGGKLWSGAKKVAAAAKKSATTDTGVLNTALGWIKSAVDKLASTKFGKAMSGFLTPLSKFFDDILAKVAKNGSKATDLLAKLSTKVTSLAGTIGKVLAGLNVVMIAGAAIDGAFNPERLFMINKKYVDWKMRVIATIFNALTSTAVGAVIDLVAEIVNAVIGVDFIQSIACIVYYAVSDEEDDKKLQNALTEFEQETANYNEANNTNISVDAYNDLKNKGLAGSAWNWAKNLVGKGDKTDYSQYEVGTYKSTGNGVGATGYGFAKAQSFRGNGMQTDPRWANMNLGMFPNGSLSTMATGGCGPTALSNAANYLGLGANPGLVGKFAMNNGYISQGGANDALFDEGASKMGLSTKKVSTDADIVNSLRRGKPVIMAGKSSGYGNNTPYTKAGHIITATKLNADGTVTVQDPMRGVGKYKLSDLQSKMTAGWSVDKNTRKSRGYGLKRRARGYGLFDAIGNILSAGASSALTGTASKLGLSNFLESASGATDTASNGTDNYYAASGSTNINLQGNTQAEQIWNYLIGQGYTPEAAAGIMGCWQIESSNRSDRVEGDYLKNFPGFQSVLASNQALNNYTTSFLFPAYERSNISINKNGYKGTDGNYYPGIGLAQWTGSRGYNLFKFSRDNGIDWRNLDTQLAFFNQEIQQRGVKDIFNSATTAADGAHKVLDYYEMYKGYGAKAPSALKKRQDAANSIYSQYKNKTPTSTTKSAVGNGRGARGYGLFDAIGNVLSAGASNALTGAASSLGLSNFLNTSSTTGDTGATFGDGTVAGSIGSFTPMSGSEGQKAVVNQMSSIQGKIKYSLKPGEQNPDNGTASCASTVGWAYRKALGVNNMSASSTTQSKDSRFSTIWTNNGTPLDKSMLQPGDILYQNWDGTSNNGTMQHTEMYAGNGQDLSHGGKPEYGPVFKDLDDYRIKHTMMVRRYNGFLAGTGTSTGNGIGYGIGPSNYGEDDPFNGSMNLSASGQIGGSDRRPTSYSRGYGSAFNNTAGMETRLDTIIGLMRQIISKGSAVANNVTNNINYGPGDKNVNVTPSAVVIKETDRTAIGKHDASNEYLRAQHRRLATAQHD